jgi:DNA repair exonuclease SbcCD ATPase subunit
MTKTRTEDDLTRAKDTLEQLRADLPRMHSLLQENEQAALALKETGAALDDIVQVRGRIMVCREMLQQAQHDVDEARAEVERLEQVAQREHTISTMADAAKRGKQQRQVLESAMAAANAALLKNLEKIDGARTGMIQARSDFLNAGGTLTAALRFTQMPRIWSAEKQAAEIAAGEAILSELTSQGTDLQDVLYTIANEDPRHSVFDRQHGRSIEIPEPFGPMLHDAVQAYRKHKFNLNNEQMGGDRG